MILGFILLVIGITGLIKRRVKISSKRELVGAPVLGLSIFYLVMAGVAFFVGGFDLVMVGIVGVVTLAVIIFVKGRPVIPKVR